jgi:hypothetical protein
MNHSAWGNKNNKHRLTRFLLVTTVCTDSELVSKCRRTALAWHTCHSKTKSRTHPTSLLKLTRFNQGGPQRSHEWHGILRSVQINRDFLKRELENGQGKDRRPSPHSCASLCRSHVGTTKVISKRTESIASKPPSRTKDKIA